MTTPKLSTYDKEQILRERVLQWVNDELKGRYREFVSDVFLASLLTHGVARICHPISNAFEKRETLAYDEGCKVFEFSLEHSCRAGGNGHHVAQSFANFIKEFSWP